VDKRGMAVLSSGHLATDLASGAVPALVPFFVAKWSLSYTLAGLIVLGWAVSSSVVQPVFGLVSDRRGATWLLPLGVALGGVGIGLAAVAPGYWAALALIVVSGLGTAAFHPEGSKYAAYVSGEKRASGMSLFSIGGNIGYAIGPIAATALVVWLGLGGALLLAVPTIVVAAMIVALLPYLDRFTPERGHIDHGAGPDRLGPLALLLGVVALRSVGWFGLISFVPLWEVTQGRDEAYGNRILALMLLAGGIGTLVAGPLADRLGFRPVVTASVVACTPLTAVYLVVGGPAGAVALALVGMCVTGTFGVTMVMSQEYLPRHIGLASGLSIGLSIGLGGVAAVGLGALADAVDLETALWVSAGAPVVAAVLCLLLPPTTVRAAGRVEPVVP
jgi:FSR family fosmidomycin resistance protein-like MFS transporter